MLDFKRILVTGGAGFIGSSVVEHLALGTVLKTATEVIIVDNLTNGKRENVEPFLSDNIRLAVEDIRDEKKMAELMEGVDLVLHLACLGVRHSIHSPMENHDVNATGTLKLLIAARAKGVKRFVYTSSSEVYGTSMWTDKMTEDHPTYPCTAYGTSKLAGECYTRAFNLTYGFETVILRPFNSYGPRCHHEGDSGEVIPKFLLRCLADQPMVIFGDGNQTRDFTFVTETARGILLAALSDQAIGRTINLGCGREVTINELSRHVANVCGRKNAEVIYHRGRPGDVLKLHADSALAKELLGFEVQVGFEEGLERLRDWYLASGKSPQDLLASEIVQNWSL